MGEPALVGMRGVWGGGGGAEACVGRGRGRGRWRGRGRGLLGCAWVWALLGVGVGFGGTGGVGGVGEDPLGPRFSVHFPGEAGVGVGGVKYDWEALADPHRFVHMTAHDGKKYACELPAVAKGIVDDDRPPRRPTPAGDAGAGAGAEGGRASAMSAAWSVEDALEEALMVGVDAERAGGMVGGTVTPCFYRREGWWTYEYCWRRHVRQYHEKEVEVVDPKTKKVVGKRGVPVKDADFYLGFQQQPASHAAAATVVRTSGADGLKEEERVGVITRGAEAAVGESDTFYSHFLAGGTKCDLTGEPREVEVRFTCSKRSKELSTNMVTSISEVKTCKYVLNFETFAICNQGDFHAVGEDPVHRIHCYDFPDPQPPTEAAGVPSPGAVAAAI